MATILELAERMKALGTVRVLDLRQATFVRGILNEWIHDGVYYLLPPEGTTGAELKGLWDEYRDRDLLHLAYNAQSALDINHKPILSLDTYAEKYFGDPPHGLVKITAVARNKVAELTAIIGELKKPFKPSVFPDMGQLVLTEYKEPAAGRQTTVALKYLGGDWKKLTALEDALKTHLAESNLLREILVSRHGVKDLEPEVILTSTDATTPFGNKFMSDLAIYLQERQQVAKEVITREPGSVMPEVDTKEGPNFLEAALVHRKEAPPAPDPSALYRTALETLGATLSQMKSYIDLPQAIRGNQLQITFSKRGLIGIGGHFDKDHEKVLSSVYQSVRGTHGLQKGWSASFYYDRNTRVLSIKAGPESERPLAGWTGLDRKSSG